MREKEKKKKKRTLVNKAQLINQSDLSKIFHWQALLYLKSKPQFLDQNTYCILCHRLKVSFKTWSFAQHQLHVK